MRKNSSFRPAATLLGLLVTAALLLTACVEHSQLNGLPTMANLPPPDRSVAAPVEAVSQEYRIGPNDKLSVTVFPAEANFSVPSTRINDNGAFVMPRVGIVVAQGKTTQQLTREIETKLQACCLREPQVFIQVEETISQQITVAGAVKTSNVYNLRGRTTLMQAISMAGGVDNTTANMKRIGISRTVNGQRVGATFNGEDIIAGRAPDPEVFGGDMIIVDTSDSKSIWRSMIQALPLATIFMAF